MIVIVIRVRCSTSNDNSAKNSRISSGWLAAGAADLFSNGSCICDFIIPKTRSKQLQFRVLFCAIYVHNVHSNCVLVHHTLALNSRSTYVANAFHAVKGEVGVSPCNQKGTCTQSIRRNSLTFGYTE